MKLAFAAAAIAAITLASAGFAQSFNIDFNTATDVGAGMPATSFGAAANQPGAWNPLAGGMTAQQLVDLAGVLTSVTFSSQSVNGMINSSGNGLGTVNDAQKLLADALDLGIDGASDTFFINGLQNGNYTVYTYAMAPESGAHRTNVDVNNTGVQQVGGAYAGAFVQGVTHSVHTVTVTTGIITLQTFVPDLGPGINRGSLAGIQIVSGVNVPTPGVLVLLAVAAVFGWRGRRVAA